LIISEKRTTPAHESRRVHDEGTVTRRSLAWAEAAAEFQKIIDHGGIAPVAPEYSLRKLGLGHAYVSRSLSRRGLSLGKSFPFSGEQTSVIVSRS
jgi:hypothetical protein